MELLWRFCNAERSCKDPFIIVVIWRDEVYLKACHAELFDPGLYLIGPEDLSMMLVMLLGVAKARALPEGPIAFGMYLSDYSCIADRHLIGPGVPIFAYLSRDTSWLIPWPSSFTLISSLEVEDMLNSNPPPPAEKWPERDAKAYWIGTVTGPWELSPDVDILAVPRLKLLTLAKQYPDLLQTLWSGTASYGISWITPEQNISGFNANGSISVEELTGIPRASYQGATAWENYKYYLNVDGVVMGGRFVKLMCMGGVVLQHQAGYFEHVSALAKPYKHFVPLRYDLSDLVSKVQWLQQHDDKAREIAQNAKDVCLKRMQVQDHICYVFRAIEGLASKMAKAPSDPHEVAKALQAIGFTHVPFKSGDDDDMRATLEDFWGAKLEDVAVGPRQMSKGGIHAMQWLWAHTGNILNKALSHEQV